MNKIKLELYEPEARFLSEILGHIMSLLLSVGMKVQHSAIDKLKVKIDEQLLEL